MNSKILLFFLFIASNIQAQRSTKPWHNHNNYKDDLKEDVRRTYELFDKNGKTSSHISYKKDLSFIKQDIATQDDTIVVNGINIAWVNFGRDIGYDDDEPKEFHPDLKKFEEIMDVVAASGGNVLRWWYHTNGSTNPIFDDSQKVTNSPDFFHEDFKKILDLAVSKNLKIQPCLWSFDMLKDQWRVDATANKKLFTDDDYFQAYVDNALIPLVEYIGNHEGLYAWEIFNEAEGMTDQFASHWNDFKEKVTMEEIQRFINRTSSAIKNAQPDVKVTSGALGFLSAVDDKSKGYKNYYSDEELFNAGGLPDGYLNFYNIHFYKWAGQKGSPFHNTFSSTNLDKPTVIAEYYPEKTFGIQGEQLGIELMKNNWQGSLVWSWTDREWDEMSAIVEIISSFMQIDNFLLNELNIAPNPSTGELYINGLSEETKIDIVNVLGISVKQFSTENRSIRLNISDLSNGLYLFNFQNQKISRTLPLLKK